MSHYATLDHMSYPKFCYLILVQAQMNEAYNQLVLK